MCFLTSHMFFNLTFNLTSVCVLHMASTSLRLELTSHLVNLVWKLYLNASALTDHFMRSKVLDKYISHCHIAPPRMFSDPLIHSHEDLLCCHPGIYLNVELLSSSKNIILPPSQYMFSAKKQFDDFYYIYYSKSCFVWCKCKIQTYFLEKRFTRKPDVVCFKILRVGEI